MHPTFSQQVRELEQKGYYWAEHGSRSSVALALGWWGAAELEWVSLELISASWCCALAVLTSCPLKAVSLHNLSPLGRSHGLPFMACWGIVTGWLSQAGRVRHSALSVRLTLWKELFSASQAHFPASWCTCIVQAETEIKLTSLWCGQPGLEPCRETERKTTWQWGWVSLVSKCYRMRKSDRLAVTWPFSQAFVCGEICLLRPKSVDFPWCPHTSSLASSEEMTSVSEHTCVVPFAP